MDFWHVGIVITVSFTVMCEALHGFCLYWKERAEILGAPEPGADLGDAYDQHFLHQRLDWLVLNSKMIRSMGRLCLAGFLIAGFADGQLDIPWFDFPAEKGRVASFFRMALV